MEKRTTYEDRFTVIRDVVDPDAVDTVTGRKGVLMAREVIFKNEFGAVEKEYHRVFHGEGVQDVR